MVWTRGRISRIKVTRERGGGPPVANIRHTPRKLDTFLILHFGIDFKSLERLGKEYPWPRLECCPRCSGRRLWGHGYVLRYFDGWPEGLWMKRYRCVSCGAIHTMRPSSHWRGFWAPWRQILASMRRKLKKGRWLSGLSRQRQQYWWKGFAKQAARERHQPRSLDSLKELVGGLRILCTHSLQYCEMRPFGELPHRMFAVTAGGG
jgi:hypothetical protein